MAVSADKPRKRTQARRPQGKAAGARKAQKVVSYLPYVKALRVLEERLGATAHELAGWIFMGPRHGGLAAYTHANELSPPPRFFFDPSMGENYLSPMAACWFTENDIESFEPVDRFVTGAELLTRWADLPGVDARGFIAAKIRESRLIDLHPTFGGTRAAEPDAPYPPLEDGLFVRAHVAMIEADDFGWTEGQRVNLPVGSRQWRSQTARKAANALHAKPGGSREKQEQIRKAWASGKYTSRDRCAEEECGALGISYSTARKALTNTPNPSAPSRC